MKIRRIALFLALVLCAAWMVPVHAWAAETEPLVLRSKKLQTAEFIGEVCYYYNEDGLCVREEWGTDEKVVEYFYYDGALESAYQYRKGALERITAYDTHGNVRAIATVDDNMQMNITEYTNTYDEEGRLSTCQWQETGTGILNGQIIRYEYDEEENGGMSLLVTNYYIEDGARQEHTIRTYDFDGEGRLTAARTYLENFQPKSDGQTYTYDSRGNLTQVYSITSSDGSSERRTTTYTNTYNFFGMLVRVERGYTATITGTDGTQREESAENDWYEEYRYNLMGQIIREEKGTPDGEWIYVSTWEYDAHSNLLKATEDGRTVEENVYVPLSQALYTE